MIYASIAVVIAVFVAQSSEHIIGQDLSLVDIEEKVAVVIVVVAVKAVEAAVAVDVVGREPLEEGPSGKHLEPKLNWAVNLSSNF